MTGEAKAVQMPPWTPKLAQVHVTSFFVVFVVFVFCGWCVFCFVVGVGWSPSVHQWNDIIRLWHYEHRTSLAVISTASKHLHNDLAKAVGALEQKKLFLSNMQLNVLNDLAKVKRRWTEKTLSKINFWAITQR